MTQELTEQQDRDAHYIDVISKALGGSTKSLTNISSALLRRLHPIPNYSTLTEPQVRNVMTTTVGSNAVAYFNDPEIRGTDSRMGETMVLLARRPNPRDPEGVDFYACTGGGFTTLGGIDHETDERAPQEQPKDGAVRELREETVNDKGEPVLTIAPERLQLVQSGIDYRNPNMPTAYSCHAVELLPEEYKAMQTHAERLATDKQYLEGVQKHAWDEGLNLPEVTGYDIIPLSKAAKLQPDQFAHPHELSAIHDLDAMLNTLVTRDIGNAR